jgi:hypothetical protein
VVVAFGALRVTAFRHMQVTKEKMGKDKETQAIIQASPNTPIISITISKAHGKYGCMSDPDADGLGPKMASASHHNAHSFGRKKREVRSKSLTDGVVESEVRSVCAVQNCVPENLFFHLGLPFLITSVA